MRSQKSIKRQNAKSQGRRFKNQHAGIRDGKRQIEYMNKNWK